jgi:uncharacterized protein YjdB
MRSNIQSAVQSFSFALLAAVGLSGCPAKVATIEIAPPELKIKSDADTKSLSATPKDKDGQAIEGKQIAWSSSDPAVVTVDEQGKVKPVGSGKATITAKADEASGSANVEVVLLKGIKLESPAIVIKAGTPNPPLKVAFTNEKGEIIENPEAKVEWKSADPNVATVGPDGAVTGVNAGSTTITALVDVLKADVAVTVNPGDAPAGADAGPEGATPPAPAPTK